MSDEPLVNNNDNNDNNDINGNNINDNVPFDETVNIIYCCLSINSTTIYSYDNNNMNMNKNDVNYVEIISQKLGEINEIQENRIDHINLSKNLRINNKDINLEIYYKKILMENSDLITIVILCSNKLLSSFVNNLLEKLSNEYINEYYNFNKRFEFKIRLKEIIIQEEGKLIQLVQNYGSVEDEISQVREIMNDNIDKILIRGDNLDSLINKTSNLNTNSNSFRRRTIKIKRNMMFENMKLLIIIIIIIIIVLSVIFIGAKWY